MKLRYTKQLCYCNISTVSTFLDISMEVNNAEIKDGDSTHPPLAKTPSIVDVPNRTFNGIAKTPDAKKKRRRGKSKRKIMKPNIKIPWPDRRNYDKTKRNNRFRTIVLAKTHAPFNNNQFLMEIHKPEPENNFALQTPSARTRDSSFSMDSEENYFFSLPEDEEEYLTKEFSSVYEDAQSERLSSMSKNDLIQEYLVLEVKYENLIKRTERVRPRYTEEDKDTTVTEKDTSVTDRDSMMTDKDTSATSAESSAAGDTSFEEIMQKMKEQEEQIQELQLANEKLRLEIETLRQRAQDSSSEDSESDSSSTSVSSSSSSSRTKSPVAEIVPVPETNGEITENHNGQNGIADEAENSYPLVNGFHSPGE